MKHNWYKTLLLGMLLALPSLMQAEDADSLHILWVGNSYTYVNDLPTLVTQIAAEQGIKLSPSRVLKGGQRLRGQLKTPKLYEELKKGNWDYVVLQEQSTLPAQHTRQTLEETYTAAHELDSLVHAYAPKAKTIFYMSWGHKFKNEHDGKEKDPAYPLDSQYDIMQMRVIVSYLEMTYDNKALCAPVGLAWKDIMEHHPEINLYKKDNYHPSLEGTFLAAHCFISTIMQRPYNSNLTFGLPEDQARILQEAARKATFAYSKFLGWKN